MPQQVSYLDFHLEISREGDRYLASVRASPAGTCQRVPLRWPFPADDAKRENLLLQLELAIARSSNKKTYRSGPISGEEKILREFGSEIFRAVFQECQPVASLFRGSQAIVDNMSEQHGMRVKLDLAPRELAMLPWEYVFDGSSRDAEYLCLENKPLVRFSSIASARPLMPVEGPLRVLAMVSNPAGPWRWLDTEAERRVIDDAFKRVPADLKHFRWVDGGTRDDLFKLMREGPWHVFHFIGHGGVDHYTDSDGAERSEGYVVLQDGFGDPVKVSASHLGDILKGGRVKLAVLNCCDSGRGSASRSVGAAVVDSSVPLAVAMQFPITNESASRFSEEFYRAVINGDPVEAALTSARQFMQLESHLEWGIPVLFTRTDSSVLFTHRAMDATVAGGLSADVRADHGGASPADRKPVYAPDLKPTPTPDAGLAQRPALQPAQKMDHKRAQALEELRRLWEGV